MLYVGADLHKSSIVFCVVVVEDRNEVKVVKRRKFATCFPQQIREFLASLGEFQLVVEATASYEWFVDSIDDLADRVVLAHPGKMRVIAESVRKNDKIDAFVLADFLAKNQIPEAWRPTARVRQHRHVVRERQHCQSRITSVKCRIRNLLADYNADLPGLFSRAQLSAAGEAHIKKLKMREEERFVLQERLRELHFHREQLHRIEKRLAAFAKQAPTAEREARKLLASVPGVGKVATEVILSEIGDIRRFSSQAKLTSYAGLTPGFRSSDGKRQDLRITKQGSKLLRWIMVEVAWSAVRVTARWKNAYQRLKARRGAKKAIVAIARRLLCVIGAVLMKGEAYEHARCVPVLKGVA